MLQLLLALAAGAGSAGMSGWRAWTRGEVLSSAPPLTHASSPHHAPLSPHSIRSLRWSERRRDERRFASRRLLPIKKLREALQPKDVDMLIHTLTHLDANGDGSVSKEEVLHWMAALDVDHDGKVSEEEMQFMVLAKGGSEESFSLIWRRLDVNGDGYVSLFEVAEVFGVDELLLQTDSHRVLVLGGNGFVGREVVREAVRCGFTVTSLSRRGQNPEPNDADLSQAKWVSGDATDPKTVQAYVDEADAVVHAVGLLFDSASGMRTLNRWFSGSGSTPDEQATYSSVTRDSAFVAVEAVKVLF